MAKHLNSVTDNRLADGNSAVSARVTIRDVASAAGVSISTVSLYTQGRTGVSETTAARIAQAIQQLGYVPRQGTQQRFNGANANKGKERKGTKLFALLLEEMSLSAFPETLYGAIIKAMETEATRQGYNMILSVIAQEGVPQIVTEGQVDGVVILGGCPLNDQVARQLAAHQIPLLLLDNYVVGAAIDAIVPDNEWGGYQAIQHLVGLGHRRIAIIEGPAKYKTLTDRLWGALRAAHDLAIEIPRAYRPAPQSSGQPLKGYCETKTLLALSKPPTAIFAISDKSAFGAMEAIREAGLRVPQDISLIGFDNEVRAEHTSPPLTTLHLPKRQMGALAMQRLLGRIHDPLLPPVRTCLPVNLVVRDSTTVLAENRL
ncbi:MAG: LacI family DNA-binding transcriptional regulator [Caldilineaceae bacterium]|nr:LacI family DNA-binding transcriptional regulator [Caldilineaceae bacterium]